MYKSQGQNTGMGQNKVNAFQSKDFKKSMHEYSRLNHHAKNMTIVTEQLLSNRYIYLDPKANMHQIYDELLTIAKFIDEYEQIIISKLTTVRDAYLKYCDSLSGTVSKQAAKEGHTVFKIFEPPYQVAKQNIIGRIWNRCKKFFTSSNTNQKEAIRVIGSLGVEEQDSSYFEKYTNRSNQIYQTSVPEQTSGTQQTFTSQQTHVTQQTPLTQNVISGGNGGNNVILISIPSPEGGSRSPIISHIKDKSRGQQKMEEILNVLGALRNENENHGHEYNDLNNPTVTQTFIDRNNNLSEQIPGLESEININNIRTNTEISQSKSENNQSNTTPFLGLISQSLQEYKTSFAFHKINEQGVQIRFIQTIPMDKLLLNVSSNKLVIPGIVVLGIFIYCYVIRKLKYFFMAPKN